MPVEDEPAHSPDVSASRDPLPSPDASMAVVLPPMIGSPASSIATSLAFSAVKFPVALELPASSAFLIRAGLVKRPLASLVEWTALAWDGDAFTDPLMRLTVPPDTARETMRLIARGSFESLIPLTAGQPALFSQTNAALLPFSGSGDIGAAAAVDAMLKAATQDASLLTTTSFMKSVAGPVGAEVFYSSTASNPLIVVK